MLLATEELWCRLAGLIQKDESHHNYNHAQHDQKDGGALVCHRRCGVNLTEYTGSHSHPKPQLNEQKDKRACE